MDVDFSYGAKKTVMEKGSQGCLFACLLASPAWLSPGSLQHASKQASRPAL
jgi:hypothetical protein